MPRGKPKGQHGGVRVGNPGTSYGQRTDLHQTVPGQQYGAAAQQKRALQAVPAAPAAQPQPVQPAGQAQPVQPAGTPIGGAVQPDGSLHPDALTGMQQPPGSAGDPLRPSDQPDQPVTHGSPSGPGAGPEAWTPPPPPRPETAAIALLSRIPAAGQSDQVRNLLASLHTSTLNEMAP